MAAVHADSLPDDPLQYLFSLEQFGVKLDLDNISAIVSAMGHPERAYATLHVAGTNGKGSVTAMLESMLRHSGVRTGRYTSPHLIDLTERFAVNGMAVSEAALREVVTHVRDTVTALQRGGRLDVHPTFFEITTATAFEIFRRNRVEVAVFEVGLGGRLDATNVITPKVTAITTIARDHEQYLGTSLGQIAREKAGIIKPGIPVVVGDLPAEALAVVEDVARTRQAPVIRASKGSIANIREDGHVHIATPDGDYGEVPLALAGAHQAANALLAVRVAEVLAATTGLSLPREAVRRGLAEVRWPGRLERIMLDDHRDLILDAAHNPAGAETLAHFLRGESRRRTLVFAAMRDKDIDGILRPLVPQVDAVVLTGASHPRADDPHALAARVLALAPDLAVHVVPDPAEALRHAWRISSAVVVAGSIFLLGDVMKALGRS